MVDQSEPTIGMRDFALLLMMASYGMGAGEVRSLQLDDINWRAELLRVIRPKTAVETSVPLLPEVGRAVANYLQHGRPDTAVGREVFVRVAIPHTPLSTAAIYHILRKYARLAGLSLAGLGSHALRRSHACRQTERGVPPKILSEILGHDDLRSASRYAQVATKRLRGIALPVPR
jgi:integrase/recombinase XerD